MQQNHTQIFVAEQPRLTQVAYSFLGSMSDAEDIVQDAFIKWGQVDLASVKSASAYLATMVTHLCINHVNSARKRKEEYVGTWLPEPILTADYAGVDAMLEMADLLSMSFLLMLQELNPVERAVFLLRIGFDYEYAEIAEITGKTEVYCRQIVSRSRKRLGKPVPSISLSKHAADELLGTFMRACRDGDMDVLTRLLSEDIAVYADSGGKTVAPRKPFFGANKAATFLIGAMKKLVDPSIKVTTATVNGRPGLVTTLDGSVRSVLNFEITSGKITQLYLITNPEKLARLTGELEHISEAK